MGPDQKTGIISIANLLQEVAGNHAVAMWGRSTVGFASDPSMKDLIFVMTRMQIQMERYPRWCVTCCRVLWRVWVRGWRGCWAWGGWLVWWAVPAPAVDGFSELLPCAPLPLHVAIPAGATSYRLRPGSRRTASWQRSATL